MNNHILISRHAARQDQGNDFKWLKDYELFDTPLSKLGFCQSKQTAKKLTKYLKTCQYFYSSPLSRCIQTATVIQKYAYSKGLIIPIRIDYSLSEIPGIFVMLEVRGQFKPKEIFKRFPDTIFDQKYTSKLSITDLDSFYILRDISGLLNAVKDFDLSVRKKLNKKENTWYFTHANNIPWINLQYGTIKDVSEMRSEIKYLVTSIFENSNRNNWKRLDSGLFYDDSLCKFT